MKTWKHTSPSQIATFKDCKRKWWRVSVNGERQPPTPSAERGSRIHTEIEEYIINGTPCIDGTSKAIIQRLGLKAAQTDEKDVEIGFEFTPAGWPVSIRGRIDLFQSPNTITDHKTTSSLNYAKNEYELKNDIQAVVYSAIAFDLLGIEEEQVNFQLAYGTTKPPIKTEIVKTSFTKREIQDKLENYRKIAMQQKELSNKLVWQDIEPNYQSCDKYGRCNFLNDCRKQNMDTKEPKDMTSTNDFMSGLMKHKKMEKNIIKKKRYVELDETEKAPVSHETSEPIELDETEKAPEELNESAEDWTKRQIQQSQYRSFNSPDGLPDGEPLPESMQVKKKQVYRFKGKSVSSLKKAEAVDILKELEVQLGDKQREIYLQKKTSGQKLATLKDNIKVILQVKNGEIAVSEKDTTRAQGFESLLTKPQSIEEKIDTFQEKRTLIESEREKPNETNKETEQNETMKETQKHKKTNLLLIDCCSQGSIEADLVLYPMIQKIEDRTNTPIGFIEYGKGWIELANHVQREGFFNDHNIIRIDSTHPAFKHLQHTLINQADLVIRANK